MLLNWNDRVVADLDNGFENGLIVVTVPISGALIPSVARGALRACIRANLGADPYKFTRGTFRKGANKGKPFVRAYAIEYWAQS